MQGEGRGSLHETIVRHVRDIITVVDAGGVVRFANVRSPSPSAADEPAGKAALSWVHPDDRELALERRQWLLGAPGRTSTTVLRVRFDEQGAWRHVETHGVNMLDDPQVQGLLYITRDVEDRVRAESRLVHALATQNVVADLGLRALRSHDVNDVVREGMERVAGLLGTPWVTLLLLDERDRLRVRLQRGPDALPAGRVWDEGAQTQAAVTLQNRHETIAEDLEAETRFSRTPEQVGHGIRSEADVLLEGTHAPLGVLSVAGTQPRQFGPADVQFLQSVANVFAGALEREKRERSAVVRALHDPLTGLPTRPLFADRLRHSLSRIRRSGSGGVALLLVDLNRFKAVNDAWGHAAGDQVLRALGPRLAGCARAVDTVARYGGDEFVLLLENDVTPVSVTRVADSVRRACAEPIVLDGGATVVLTASVGAAWSTEEGADADALLAAADAAMYCDKRALRGED